MPRTTYDPEIRQSKSGARLYQTWKRMRKHLHNEDWDKFEAFYRWSIEEGYVPGDRLKRYDDTLPHGPDNSFWQGQDEGEFSLMRTLEWCEKWDQTVNKLRKQFGLPPLKEDGYD